MPKRMLTAGLGFQAWFTWADFLMATKYSDNFKVILVTEHKKRTGHIHVALEHLQLH